MFVEDFRARRAWNALGAVLYAAVQVHGDSACFAASAKGLCAAASIKSPKTFRDLKDYVMAWMELQRVVDALMDANGEVMLVWHTANALGDSGPTPRVSFEDQRIATLWCLRQRQHTFLAQWPSSERSQGPRELYHGGTEGECQCRGSEAEDAARLLWAFWRQRIAVTQYKHNYTASNARRECEASDTWRYIMADET